MGPCWWTQHYEMAHTGPSSGEADVLGGKLHVVAQLRGRDREFLHEVSGGISAPIAPCQMFFGKVVSGLSESGWKLKKKDWRQTADSGCAEKRPETDS